MKQFDMKNILVLIAAIMISTGFCAMAQNPVLPDSLRDCQSPLDMELFLAGNFAELRNNHFHAGLDFKTQGTVNHPVYSFADGYVCRVGINALGYGLVVYVRHPQLGLTSVYAHLNSFCDRINEKMRPRQIALEENNIQLSFEPNEIPVKKGEVIAKSGNTGSSGGPHVHFELRDCNDANDEFYNPMPFFRDQISDRKAPRASHIYIYPLGGLVCGQNARQTVTVITAQSGQRTVNRNLTAWGRVGLGLKAFDYIENQANTYGVYRIQLYKDDQLIYHFVADRFRFSERRYTNSLTDYRAWMTQRSMIQKSYIEPGNHLSMIDRTLGDGTFVIDEERPYRFRYVLTDAHGNQSEVFFQIKGKKAVLPKDPFQGLKTGTFTTRGILVRSGDALSFDSLGCRIQMRAGNLYSTATLPFKRTVQTDPNRPCVSDVYVIGSASIALHGYFDLTLPLPKAYADTLTHPEQLYVANLDGGYLGGTYKNGAMHVRVREFGRFAVRRDSSKPNGVVVSMTMNRAQISVSDRGSGIARYKVFIDEHFVPFDLNRYGKRIGQPKYYGIQKGKMHDVRIWVQDNCGNETTVRTKKFF
ncbi:MAG: M23 family metallopeptidase [Bacteroidales bacterium]|nr:M23 family metallopeptidase [Bacteroidales bacterium]